MDPVKVDLVAHVTTLFGPPLGEVHRDRGAVWLITGDPDPHRNGVVHAPIQPGDSDGLIPRLLQPFKEGAQPMMWWVFTSGADPQVGVHEALLSHGLILESDRPSLMLDLSRLDLSSNPTIEVTRVRDEEGFRGWADVVGDAFGDEAYKESVSIAAFRRFGFDDDAPYRHYIGFDGGSAVSAATLCLAGGVAGFSNIATRPAFRRRGFGRATLGRALHDAAAQGLATAALSSDPGGTQLYLKLGFQEYGRHLTYLWLPPSG